MVFHWENNSTTRFFFVQNLCTLNMIKKSSLKMQSNVGTYVMWVFLRRGPWTLGITNFVFLKSMQDIFNFSCSRGKVSMDLPFEVYWAGQNFKSQTAYIFLDRLLIYGRIYRDNLYTSIQWQRENTLNAYIRFLQFVSEKIFNSKGKMDLYVTRNWGT